MARTLEEYRKKVKGKCCRICRNKFTGKIPLNYYIHDNGWDVRITDQKVERFWLYVICPQCKYQNSFEALYIPRQ